MAFKWLKPVLFSLGVVLLSATLSPAALPNGEEPPGAASLVGQFLVAAPMIEDAHFRHTVILIVVHDANGAAGIVINRPVGARPLAELLGAIGLDSAGITASVRVFAGGPVEPGRGFIVHSAEYRRAGTIGIDSHVALTPIREALPDIARERGPAKSLVALGYAGWRPGRLEAEMARGGWFLEPEDPGLIFNDDKDKVWDEAIARHAQGIPP